MIFAYKKGFTKLEKLTHEIPLWVDLLCPTVEEDDIVEKLCGVNIPTREDMSEIEPSNRLYYENKTAYMTASVICHADKKTPILTDVSFILAPETFITVRYDEPKSFDLFIAHGAKIATPSLKPEMVFTHLLDTIIDRNADILEKSHAEIERASSLVFADKKMHAETYRTILRAIGKEGALISKIRESMVSLSRMLLFVSVDHEGKSLSKEAKLMVKTQARDVEYLSQHCDSLSDKISFLMDATLGLVSLEQNAIIKIFSVASVALMPPTLIASIYGMNFKDTPPFEWAGGFNISLVMMVVSAIVPYVFFKWKKWL